MTSKGSDKKSAPNRKGEPDDSRGLAELESCPAEEAPKEEPFLIAADLTLYNNPVSRITQKTVNLHAKKVPKPEREMIAADLTKYGSPLDDKD